MNFRLILFPFAIIYALITEVRNFLYDKGVLKSYQFDIPVISVGNLNVGGSGKTPQIEYLIRLLQKDFKIAVISRGYKRLTRGFIEADKNSTPEIIGDEPYQIYRKFKNVIVAVGENRVNAVHQVLKKHKPDVILLDDAFQHRRIKPGLQILLTPCKHLFYKDRILPVGNLRELRKNVRRADMVIVSKIPDNFDKTTENNIRQNIKKYTVKPVFFSKINYAPYITNEKKQLSIKDLTGYKILLVTGIADPSPLYAFLSKKNINFEGLKFSDHHRFTANDIKHIEKKFAGLTSTKKLILTTEKDFVKLSPNIKADFLYYLPVQTEIINSKEFNKKVIDYVKRKK